MMRGRKPHKRRKKHRKEANDAMPVPERIELIKEIERIRGSKVICYLTSLRPGVPSQIGEDAIPVIFDHLLLLPERPVEKLDIFLVSNGGSGTAPWRLVSLFREFSNSFNVIIPYRAYSAATLLALGADEIVMHPFAELGPIDPTVSNDFNPIEEGRRIGISVEDVKAYVQFIKSTVGISAEEQLVRTIEILAQKVHPLALGNVERFISQSRMIARKIMGTHMADVDENTIDEIVENMASKLYFHGHPINRREAKTDLKLKVNADLQPELESAIWKLYKSFEKDFDNQNHFLPGGELAAKLPRPTPTNVGQPAIAQEEFTLLHTIIESTRLVSKQASGRRYTLVRIPQTAQQAMVEDIITQGWSHEVISQETEEGQQQ
jgi:hypothetical protein